MQDAAAKFDHPTWSVSKGEYSLFRFGNVIQIHNLMCGVAAIVRNSSGQVLDGLSLHSLAHSATVAEASALTLVCSLCAKFPASTQIIVESDALSLIDAILNPHLLVDWAAQPLVLGLRLFAQASQNVSWVFTSRDANKAADCIASLARRRMCPASWLQQPPSSLFHILLFDGDPPP